MVGKWLAGGVLALVPAFALAEQAPVAQAWRAIAAADSAAALKLIEENHPGATQELGDTQFLARLALARRHVEERLPKVDSFGAYNALMNGLAAEFRDGHIWTAPHVSWAVRKWPGIMPVRRGGKWYVGLDERKQGGAGLRDAEILACDGEEFDRWAKTRIGLFGGPPEIEAELSKRAPGLLLDDANPFIKAPSACTFRTVAGATEQVQLEFRQVLQTGLSERAARIIPRAAAGMGVSKFDGGYWIALGTLGNAAADVVKAVSEQAEALRSAPMVVIDMRGNTGGNSIYSSEIARILHGRARVDALDISADGCRGSYWRVSEQNRKTVTAARDAARARKDNDSAAYYAQVADDMTKAMTEGRNFSPALPACAASVRTVDQGKVPASLPAPAMQGRLVIVTDSRCFSSCLLATNAFRQLGALHVGEATDMSTRYMEVYEVMLPSGMRTFSTLQKVAVGLGDYGPYQPHKLYPGSLADTDPLKAWVAALR
ncbi:S41 family peptidase [Pseudoduganella sp. GCM10020061]|uniref:S41 family peptidase n=1 Tax=Pseudoduganella sp. GCM10020061 TaxID=3317345 RepID=UPI00362B1DB3